MKNLILLIAVLSFVMGGCGGEDKSKAGASKKGDSDFIIKVTGTNGLRFKGSYTVVTSKGDSISDNIEGIVSAEYHTAKGNVVFCRAEKISEPGTLKVEIVKKTTGMSAGAETWSPHGGVIVSRE